MTTTEPGNGLNKQAAARVADPDLEIAGLEILELAGSGGICTVYKARQTAFDRIVAVKVLQAQHAANPTLVQRFNREAKLATALQHPNIASVFSLGTTSNQRPYLLMEYVSGVTLDELLQADAPLPHDTLIDIFSQCLAALAHAHNQGIVHRDLKPSNVILVRQEQETQAGRWTVKIIDFGIAKVLVDESSPESQRLTKTGALLGSPNFMSPEQCLGKSTDSRSDIYALGCMMYQAVCGQIPFTGDSALEVMSKHVQTLPMPPHLVTSESISAELEEVILKCLQKEPENRYQSAELILQHLQSITGSQKVRPNARLVQASLLLTQTWSINALKRLRVPLCIIIAVAMGALLCATYIFHNTTAAIDKAQKCLDKGDYERAADLLAALIGHPPLAKSNNPALPVNSSAQNLEPKVLSRDQQERVCKLLYQAAQNFRDDCRVNEAHETAEAAIGYATNANLSCLNEGILLNAQMYFDSYDVVKLEGHLRPLLPRTIHPTAEEASMENAVTMMAQLACMRDAWVTRLPLAYENLQTISPNNPYLIEMGIALINASKQDSLIEGLSDRREDCEKPLIMNAQRARLSHLAALITKDLLGPAPRRLLQCEDPSHMRALAFLMRWYAQQHLQAHENFEPSVLKLLTYFQAHRPANALYAITLQEAGGIYRRKRTTDSLMKAESLDTLAVNSQDQTPSLGKADHYFLLATDQYALNKYEAAKGNTEEALKVLHQLGPSAQKTRRLIEYTHLLSDAYAHAGDLENSARLAKEVLPSIKEFIIRCQTNIDKPQNEKHSAEERRDYARALCFAIRNGQLQRSNEQVLQYLRLMDREQKEGRCDDDQAEQHHKVLEALERELSQATSGTAAGTVKP